MACILRIHLSVICVIIYFFQSVIIFPFLKCYHCYVFYSVIIFYLFCLFIYFLIWISLFSVLATSFLVLCQCYK